MSFAKPTLADDRLGADPLLPIVEHAQRIKSFSDPWLSALVAKPIGERLFGRGLMLLSSSRASM